MKNKKTITINKIETSFEINENTYNATSPTVISQEIIEQPEVEFKKECKTPYLKEEDVDNLTNDDKNLIIKEIMKYHTVEFIMKVSLTEQTANYQARITPKKLDWE